MKDKPHTMLVFICAGPYCPMFSVLKAAFEKSVIHNEPGLDVLEAMPGVVIGLYGPASTAPAYLKNTTELLVSFRVDDLNAMISLAEQHGAQLLLKAKDECTGFSFCHLKFVSGHLIGFFQQ